MKRYLADLVNASEYNDYVMDTYHDKQLLEPEDNEIEFVPGDDYQEEIQIDFDVDITMDEDMSWDYPDGYAWAANSDDKDGNWYTEDDNRIFINDVTGIVEDIDVMLQTVLPAEAGTYHISGLAKLIYDIKDPEYTYDEDGNASYVKYSADVSFNPSESEIEDFKITKR